MNDDLALCLSLSLSRNFASCIFRENALHAGEPLPSPPSPLPQPRPVV